MGKNIVIVDYKMGNLHSVKKKLDRLGAKAIVSSDKTLIMNANKLILPGVGHFAKAIYNLQELDLINVLNEAVLVKKTPVLGICLGMQIMTKRSSEGNVNGLGWVDAEVIKFNVNNKLKYKVPHTGWNQINIKKDSRLMKSLPQSAEFYFVHSYHVITDNQDIVLNQTNYENEFTSAFEQGNIFGVQYHPEKSHDNGELLLKNFIEI